MSGFFTLEVHLMPPGGVINQINSQRPAGEVLESFATKTRDKNTALSFLTRMTKRHGQPKVALSLSTGGGIVRAKCHRFSTWLWPQNLNASSCSVLDLSMKCLNRSRSLRPQF